MLFAAPFAPSIPWRAICIIHWPKRPCTATNTFGYQWAMAVWVIQWIWNIKWSHWGWYHNHVYVITDNWPVQNGWRQLPLTTLNKSASLPMHVLWGITRGWENIFVSFLSHEFDQTLLKSWFSLWKSRLGLWKEEVHSSRFNQNTRNKRTWFHEFFSLNYIE